MLDPLEDPSRDTGTRSPDSEPGTAIAEFDKGALRDIGRGLLLGVTTLIHDYLARTEVEREAGLWLADEDDEQAIADPLTNYAARHAGPGVVGNPDVVDLLTAGFGVVGYGVKNGLKKLHIRNASRKVKATLPDLAEAGGE